MNIKELEFKLALKNVDFNMLMSSNHSRAGSYEVSDRYAQSANEEIENCEKILEKIKSEEVEAGMTTMEEAIKCMK